MNTSRDRSPDRVVRAAAWFYVAPRMTIGVLILGTIGLAAFLVVLALASALMRPAS